MRGYVQYAYKHFEINALEQMFASIPALLLLPPQCCEKPIPCKMCANTNHTARSQVMYRCVDAWTHAWSTTTLLSQTQRHPTMFDRHDQSPEYKLSASHSSLSRCLYFLLPPWRPFWLSDLNTSPPLAQRCLKRSVIRLTLNSTLPMLAMPS